MVQVHLGPLQPWWRVSQVWEGRTAMKKLLLLGALAAIGYVAYRQISASKAEDDLWTQATQEPDLR